MLKTTYLHSGWEFAEKIWQNGGDEFLGTPGWLSAQVPGHVHLDLVKHGIIADPFAAMNEIGCQWVDEKDWTYRTTFEWKPDPANPRRMLAFEGLDTICDIFLNDEKIAEHDNMFVPLDVDVTDDLVAGTNHLRIEFKSSVRVGTERRNEYFAANNLPLNSKPFAERAFVRKAQYMFGWDWGPRLVSCGLWKPVRLVEYQARVAEWSVTTHRQDDGQLKVSVSTGVDGEASVFHEIYDAEGNLLKEISGNSSALLKDFERWSPENPYCGYIVTRLLNASGTELDRHVQNFGDSSIKLLQEPDEFGESFEFEINGKPFWARGANWIPDHSFPSTVSRAQYRDRLEKSKDMGFNMLRVWGGGLYETDDFYELCDELGILVWQDFPFGCSYYPDDSEWQEVIKAEAEVNVKRIRNHPSLALWCGNNENEEMDYSKWGKENNPTRYYGEHHYNIVLPEVVSRLNPETPYIRTSPIGNAPIDDPVAIKQQGPNSGGYGDQHCWDVWHGRGDWKHYLESTGRFSSEYGFGSSCHLELWDKVLDEWVDEYPFRMDDAVIKWHDKTRKGWETFVGYVKLHYPEPKMLSDWVYYSQLNQRDALRLGVEHYRRSAFCKGSLIWQLNDCWPVQSWAILDSDGNYKALAYDLRRSYADRLLSIERNNDQIKVHAVNDGSMEWSLHPQLSAHPLAGGPVALRIEGLDTTLQPGERKVVLETSVKGLSAPETLLVARADDISTWQLLDEPKNARFAPAAPIYASLANEDGILTLRTGHPVVDLFVNDEDGVGAFFDNFITSPEAGVLQLRYFGSGEGLKARSLAGWHEVRLSRSPI